MSSLRQIDGLGRRRLLRGSRGTTVLLVEGPGDGAASVARCGLPTRLLARLRSHELDRRLAAGASPDSEALLSLRARELESVPVRRRLAAGYRLRLSASRRSPHPADRSIPLARVEIRRCGALVEQLATLLESGTPADPRGVARASLLLTEGNSPLYARANSATLETTLQNAIDALPPAADAPAALGGERW
jgi:hypothetical protein